MEDAISFNISGIVCDNTECDFEDYSVLFEEYPAYVNKPCPNCGENLLTQADYDSCLAMEEHAKMMNSLIGDMNPEMLEEIGKMMTPEVVEAVESSLGLDEGTLAVTLADLDEVSNARIDFKIDDDGQVKIKDITLEKPTIH